MDPLFGFQRLGGIFQQLVNVALDSVHHSSSFQLVIMLSCYAGIENVSVPLATQGSSILTLLRRGRNFGMSMIVSLAVKNGTYHTICGQ